MVDLVVFSSVCLFGFRLLLHFKALRIHTPFTTNLCGHQWYYINNKDDSNSKVNRREKEPPDIQRMSGDKERVRNEAGAEDIGQ